MQKVINSFLAILVFLVGVWSYSAPIWFFYWASGMVVLVLVVNLFRIRRMARQGFYMVQSFLPSLLLLGLFGAAAAVSAPVLKNFIMLLGSALFYFYEHYFPARIPEFLEEAVTLAAGFLLLVGTWALNFFLAPAWWIIVSLILILFGALFWQAFRKLMPVTEAVVLWTLISALTVVETSWAILYLPVFFLSAAAINFLPFYLIYMFIKLHAQGRLTKKRIYFQTAIILAVVILTLFSSSWQPLR